MRIKNLSRSTELAFQYRLADSFIARFKGLMGEKSLPSGTGLVLTPCNSVHMFFMKIPLDVLFMDKKNSVVYIIENMQPWTISKLVHKSTYVIELPTGTVNKTYTQIGDQIELEKPG